ncbi:MAG: DUF6057 family protein [Prolixibacteraceae bacterium]|jgi:hypothetical protein|nr:DUF6057 family protein [Prolixibacteraceae bacterium]
MKPKNYIIYSIVSLLAVFSFLFSFYRIAPNLHHHFQQIAFQTDVIFFKKYSCFAGGLSEYFALFIAQFFKSKFIGSILISLTGLLVSILFYFSVKLKWKNSSLVYLLIPIPQLLLLVLQTNYKYPFSVSINILFTSAFLFFSVISIKKTKVPVWLNVLIFGFLLYIISGGMYFVVFILGMLIQTFSFNTRNVLLNSLPVVVIGALIPVVAYQFIFLESIVDSYFKATPNLAVLLTYKTSLLFYVVLFIIPASYFVMFLFDKLLPFPKSLPKQQNNNILILAQLIAFIAFTFFLLKGIDQKNEKMKLRVDLEAANENWDEVIDLAANSDAYDRTINFHYNRAMAHNNELLVELFSYPQLLGAQAQFVEEPFAGEVTLLASDLYFDLGAINEAQHYALEAQTLLFYSPRVLKRLVDNCMIKGEYKAAKTYLNVLGNNLREQAWVENKRAFLNDTVQLNSDSIILEKRSFISTFDRITSSPLLRLHDLIMQNPSNKFAVDYMFAYLILNQQIEELIPYVQFLDDAGYKHFPRVVEEAFIVTKSINPNHEILSKVSISKETTDRFNQFVRIKNECGRDKALAKQRMAEFSNTYWYYILFQSPKITNASVGKRIVK